MSTENQLSRRERQIMDVLHEQGEATVAEVQAAMANPPSYSSVRAQMRILEEKGHIRHRQDGTRYVYLARVSRETASRSALKRVLGTFFSGSVTNAVAALLDASDTKLSETELNKVQEIINKAQKEGR